MKELIGLPLHQLQLELAVRTEKLALLYPEAAFHHAEELRAKSQAWESHPNESQSFREKLGTYAAANNMIMALETEARIKSLTEEKYFIRLLIDHASTY